MTAAADVKTLSRAFAKTCSQHSVMEKRVSNYVNVVAGKLPVVAVVFKCFEYVQSNQPYALRNYQ